jgi:hypothetical protein
MELDESQFIDAYFHSFEHFIRILLENNFIFPAIQEPTPKRLHPTEVACNIADCTMEKYIAQP